MSAAIREPAKEPCLAVVLAFAVLAATSAAGGDEVTFRPEEARREVLALAVGDPSVEALVTVEEIPFRLELVEPPETYHGRLTVLYHPDTGCVVADVGPLPGWFGRGEDPDQLYHSDTGCVVADVDYLSGRCGVGGELDERILSEWRVAVRDEQVVGLAVQKGLDEVLVFPALDCVESFGEALEVGRALVPRFGRWYRQRREDRGHFTSRSAVSLRAVFPREFLRFGGLNMETPVLGLDALRWLSGGWELTVTGARGQFGELFLDEEWNLIEAKRWRSPSRDLLLSEFPRPPRSRDQRADLAFVMRVSKDTWLDVISWLKTEEGGRSGDELALVVRSWQWAKLGWESPYSLEEPLSVKEVAKVRSTLQRFEDAGHDIELLELPVQQGDDS